jgi:hypothetical protein
MTDPKQKASSQALSGKGERGCYWKHLLEKLEDGGNSALQAFYEL